MIPIIIKSKKKNRNKYRKTIKYINKSKTKKQLGKTKKQLGKTKKQLGKTKKQLGGAHRGNRGHGHRGPTARQPHEPERKFYGEPFEIFPVDGRVCMLFDQRFRIYRPAPHIQHVQQDIYGPVYANAGVVVPPTQWYETIMTT